jgi:hypothetical protein
MAAFKLLRSFFRTPWGPLAVAIAFAVGDCGLARARVAHFCADVLATDKIDAVRTRAQKAGMLVSTKKDRDSYTLKPNLLTFRYYYCQVEHSQGNILRKSLNAI